MTNDADGEGQMRETLLTTKVLWDGRRRREIGWKDMVIEVDT